MSSVEYLREFVNERLTAAAEEIFGVFKQTIVEYEEEIDRQRRLLDIVLKPEIKLHRTELPQQHVCKEEEVVADQQLCIQERNTSLDQEDPEPPQIKEEQEELCTSQEGEQLVRNQDTETFMLISTYEESDDSEPESKGDHKLLSHNSHVAESQDQKGGDHGDSGSTRDAEPEASKSFLVQKRTYTGMDVECIQEIQRVLPELDFERLMVVVEYLASVVGITKKEDLAYVEKDELQHHLTPIQCQKVIQTFSQRELNDRDTGFNGMPNEQTRYLSSLDTSLRDEHVHTLPHTQPHCPGPSLIKMQNSWISQLEIPWDKMPASLSQAISRGERAKPADRRAMVRTVVSAMREHCPNPNRAACIEVAKVIVSKYPLTFADTTVEGEQLGIGYYSLVNQLKTRVEHVNRNNVSDRLRKPRKMMQTGDGSTTTKTVRCKVDRYGCINWQPKSLPEGETADSLQNRRKTMAAIFQSAGPRVADMPDIDNSMSLTYIYQRHMINTCPPPSISQVEEQWPFLFTKRGFCSHFKTLTGIDICDQLGESLQTKGKRIINFFQRRSQNRDIQSLLRDIESATTAMQHNRTGIAAVLLMMKHFLEKEDSIFILADTFATTTSIQKDMTLPATPRLIMLGNSYLTATKWMVSIEGKVAFVLEEHLGFADALSVFFGCFYVFNMEYQEPACVTLEFIQRFFVGINPEEGTKCTAKTGVSRKTGEMVKRKIAAINNRMSSFLRKLTEIEWKNAD